MAESTVGWFGVREKYCSLADKPWIISQIRPSEPSDPLHYLVCCCWQPGTSSYGLSGLHGDKLLSGLHEDKLEHSANWLAFFFADTKEIRDAREVFGS